ncbi:MAG: beta-aspartyl-peptidase [Deltaproteobacteria bacterium RBG_16_49_23]|nr:MAG: beta-aspartyl-peptidase [Deltaproteobacteria bacterium RBG_16_49_23]
MFTLIKGGTLYGPEKMGGRDILIAGRTIARVSEHIDLPEQFEARVISASGKVITPGMIDLHVHLLGGGGEGGPRTRTPEITLSKITRAGVTTVVGCLGTDDVSRRPEALLAKAMQLEEEGISTYIYCGSYQFPLATITGCVRKDIALIPKVIGVGEIAVSDHRSSQPTFEELCRVAAEARVGGMIGGKAGLVHLHMGSGKRMLDPIIRIVKETEIPIGQFLPTHVTRTQSLLEQSIQFAKMGGNIDFTVRGQELNFPLTTAKALQMALDGGTTIEQITLSSDSNGSMPIFDEKGNMIKLAVGDIQNLYLEVRGLAKAGFSLEDILKMVTSNPAKRAGIYQHKGSIEEGKDADLLILNPELKMEWVMAKGQMMVHNDEIIVRGAFEP